MPRARPSAKSWARLSPREQVPAVVGAILDQYVVLRQPGERFIDTLDRVGIAPFRAVAYPAQDPARELESV